MSKRFYRVRAIKDGDTVQPDLPPGITWAGNTDGEWYVITTEEEIPGAEEISFEEASRMLQDLTGLPGDDIGTQFGSGGK